MFNKKPKSNYQKKMDKARNEVIRIELAAWTIIISATLLFVLTVTGA